ncbi:hypothetical protein [Haloarcula sp. CGMCC 1.2071]|uniref:hypothetical protein n=1 Tax=Haloarcula sp. CGMCC 1.2071 TaxID=3111454 RepID=UPI00126779F8
MASKTTNGKQTGEQHPVSSEAQFPNLTAHAVGTADRLRRVNETAKADSLETIEVKPISGG